MSLTAKQTKALARVPASSRPALRRTFQAQRAEAAPRAKPAPAPRAKRQPRKKPEQHVNIYDGFANWHMPVPEVISSGHSTYIPSQFTQQVSTSSSQARLVLFTWAKGPVIMRTYSWDPDDTGVPPTAPTFSEVSLPTMGSPTSIQYGRLSVRVRNITDVMNMGGNVSIAMLTQGFDITDQADATSQWQAAERVAAVVRQHRNAAHPSGAELAHARQFTCYPIDQSRYAESHTPGATGTGNYTSALQNPTMSILAVYIGKRSTQNNYLFSVAASFHARYSLDATSSPDVIALANQAKPRPSLAASVINAARDAAESMPGIGKEVLQETAKLGLVTAGKAAVAAVL